MEKGRLLEVVKQHSDRDAIGMIMSNYADYGHTEKGAMISVGQFYKIADVLIEWTGQKKLEITAPELYQNVTDWVSVDQLPVENGAYLCYKFPCTPFVAYWDGKRWNAPFALFEVSHYTKLPSLPSR